MGSLSLIAPVGVGLLGGAVALYLGSLIVRPLIGDTRGLSYRWKLKKRQRLMQLADEAVESEKIPQAVLLLKGAFYLFSDYPEPRFIDQTITHNLETLGRIVALFEQRSIHGSNLPVVEGLIQSRGELLRSAFEISTTKERVKVRQAEKGKEAPEWAFEEFSKKLAEILDRLETNRKSLESQLDRLFSELDKGPAGSEITYH